MKITKILTITIIISLLAITYIVAEDNGYVNNLDSDYWMNAYLGLYYKIIDMNTEMTILKERNKYLEGRSCGGGSSNNVVTPIEIVYDEKDLNQDGIVDGTDLAIFKERLDTLRNEYGNLDCDLSNDWCNGADSNNDGIVDATDLAILNELKP